MKYKNNFKVNAEMIRTNQYIFKINDGTKSDPHNILLELAYDFDKNNYLIDKIKLI